MSFPVPSFVQPEGDAAEARARRDEPEVRALAQALEDAVSDCASDPDGEALDEKPVLKAIRLIDRYLTGGALCTDERRATFRQSLRRLAHVSGADVGSPEGPTATRVPFRLSDGVAVLWLDLYPETFGVTDTAAHVYLGMESSTGTSRTRWGRVFPRSGRIVARPPPEQFVIETPLRPKAGYAPKMYDDAGEEG